MFGPTPRDGLAEFAEPSAREEAHRAPARRDFLVRRLYVAHPTRADANFAFACRRGRRPRVFPQPRALSKRRFAPDALGERVYKRLTRRGFTTGHGSAEAARHEVDRGDRDQNQEGYLPPFDVVLSGGALSINIRGHAFDEFELWSSGGTPYDERRGGVALEDAHPRTRTDMNSISLKIGTRGSPLALAQAGEVRALLARVHGCDLERFEIVVIRTSGDMIQDRALAEAGGKGLFTREIDAAMLIGEIDVAVHSAKDLPTVLPEGIVVAGYLPREDVRDALISRRADTIAGLPRGATLGTASLRRQAQVKRLRPDLEVGLLRGNVETRLGKAERGEIDATLLAYAGLKRLGLARRATALLDIETFLPAVGQGAIGLTARLGDASASGAVAPILDAATGCALAAERAFLDALDGSCRTPIAGHARIDGGMLDFRGMVLRADGSETFEVRARGDVNEAARLGRSAGLDLSSRLPAGVLP